MPRDDGLDTCWPQDCDPDCPGADPVTETSAKGRWIVYGLLLFLCVWGLLGWVGLFTVIGWLRG